MKPSSCRLLVALLVLLNGPLLSPAPSAAQTDGLPGVRGSLYESPSYGWTMILDPAVWTIEAASSANGRDAISVIGFSNGSAVTQVLFETTPGGTNAVADCLASVAPRLAARWAGAMIRPARAEYSGEIIYDLLSDYGQMAAYFVSGIPGVTGELVAEAFCASSLNGSFIISALGIIPASRYDEGATLIDLLMETRFGQRTSEPRPDGKPPKIGVLQFHFQCARSHHVIAAPAGDATVHDGFLPPDEPLPPGQAYLLHTGWVANIDAIPSVLDLGRLIARFPDGSVRTGAALAYSPAYFGWLDGVPEEASEAVMLAPGQLAIYLVWYIVDRVEAAGGGPYDYSLDVTYEPLVGAPAYAGETSMFKSESYEAPACGAGGGARPRVRLGN